MNKTKYKECRMIQTSFLHAPLKNIDLSTCLIEAIEAVPQDVSGIIIAEMQSIISFYKLIKYQNKRGVITRLLQ